MWSLLGACNLLSLASCKLGAGVGAGQHPQARPCWPGCSGFGQFRFRRQLKRHFQPPIVITRIENYTELINISDLAYECRVVCDLSTLFTKLTAHLSCWHKPVRIAPPSIAANSQPASKAKRSAKPKVAVKAAAKPKSAKFVPAKEPHAVWIVLHARTMNEIESAEAGDEWSNFTEIVGVFSSQAAAQTCAVKEIKSIVNEHGLRFDADEDDDVDFAMAILEPIAVGAETVGLRSRGVGGRTQAAVEGRGAQPKQISISRAATTSCTNQRLRGC